MDKNWSWPDFDYAVGFVLRLLLFPVLVVGAVASYLGWLSRRLR